MKRLKKQANNQEDMIFDAINSLDIFQDLSCKHFYELTRYLLRRNIINNNMIDMPLGEFTDCIYDEVANTDEYNGFKEEILENFKNAGGTEEQKEDLFYEFEKQYFGNIQEILSDIVDEENM